MPHVTFVKKARKDNPVAKKGESYDWWAVMVSGRGGPKHYSKTPPRPSQLTQSEFLGSLYGLQERIEDLEANDGLGATVEEIASELRDLGQEQSDKKDNMPDGLQEGATGELLQERADACEAAADELEGITFDVADKEGEQTDDEYWEEKLDEVQAVSIDAS